MLKRSLSLATGVAALAVCSLTLGSGALAEARGGQGRLAPGVVDENPGSGDGELTGEPGSGGGTGTPAAATASPSPTKHSTVRKAGSGLRKGTTAYVAVSAATLWKSKTSPRSLDRPALGNPANLSAWNDAMDTTAKRRGLTGRTESQAVLGDQVRVLAINGSWAKVATAAYPAPGKSHGYEGWVPRRQLVKNAAFGKSLRSSRTAVVTATTVTTSAGTVLPFNARLPVRSTGGTVTVTLPTGSEARTKADTVTVLPPKAGLAAKQRTVRAQRAAVVKTAKRFLGLRYTWGGTSVFGFDCSGLTYTAYRAHGVILPRDSGPQSQKGTSVSPASLKPGDLLFFAGSGGTGAVHHVGMYIGDGKMIHAPNASKSVEIVRWRSWDTGGEFSGAKRYL